MNTNSIRRFALGSALAALTLGSLAVPAQAQRDPAYAAARAEGKIGEMTNGRLGIVGQSTPELEAMVADLNLRRRDVYAERAQAEGASLDEYALTAGCLAISRTVPGEMYQAPDGSWQQRTSSPPLRDPRCP